MKQTIHVVPGLEEKVRRLAHAMTLENIDTPNPTSIGDLISMMLPDLVDNALAGDMSFEAARTDNLPDTHAEEETDPDIQAAVAEATKSVEQADASLGTLEMAEAPPGHDVVEEKPGLTFSQLESGHAGEVYLPALEWAKGNPLKERALLETCLGLPPGVWGWKKTLELAERTFNMRDGGDDEQQA